ncbi:hypothetical protein AAC387_Pa09g0137 [Persea americana]
MNSNNRINLFERDSRLLERIQLNDPNLSDNFSQLVNDLICSILSPSIPLSSSIDERAQMINVAKEEAKVKEEIIRIIVSGNSDSLPANSGQSIMTAGHNVCIGVQETGYDEKVWEWHSHIVLYEDELEFMPEYFYGSFNERLEPKE